MKRLIRLPREGKSQDEIEETTGNPFVDALFAQVRTLRSNADVLEETAKALQRLGPAIVSADEQLSYKQCAAIANVTDRMIRDRVANGEIEGSQGKFGRVARSELERWIRERAARVPKPAESGATITEADEVAASLAEAARRFGGGR